MVSKPSFVTPNRFRADEGICNVDRLAVGTGVFSGAPTVGLSDSTNRDYRFSQGRAGVVPAPARVAAPTSSHL